MKKQLFLPAAAVASGAAAFALRLLQNKTGYEADTGLPIPGNIAGIALIALLILFAAAALYATRKETAIRAFPADFLTRETTLLTLPVAGLLLMLFSGLLDAMAIINPDMIPFAEPTGSPSQLIFAASAIVSAAALFPAISACRPQSAEDSAAPKSSFVSAGGNLLPLIPACLVVRLVPVYRTHSVNPLLEQYYVELLALVCFTLAFFRLSSCAFQPTAWRKVSSVSCIAIVCALAAMADPIPVSSRLLYIGCCLVLLGFVLLQRLRDA